MTTPQLSLALDEISKPVVVALLKASHADDHRPFADAAQLLENIVAGRRRETVSRSDDNSRRRVQNVRGDSAAISPAADSRFALASCTTFGGAIVFALAMTGFAVEGCSRQPKSPVA